MLFMCWCPYIVSSLEFPEWKLLKLFQNRTSRGRIWLIGWLCERAFRSRFNPARRWLVELWGRRLTDLTRRDTAKFPRRLSTEKCRASRPRFAAVLICSQASLLTLQRAQAVSWFNNQLDKSNIESSWRGQLRELVLSCGIHGRHERNKGGAPSQRVRA